VRSALSRWGTWAIAALALASSAVGASNWFTYDDRYVVELNPIMHSLHRWWTVFGQSYWPANYGGDGYRPFTILAFKVETAIGGGIPVVFHVVNILLYALCSVLVYRVARRMLPDWAAWLSAALFAVHPVHVEAVAGVVGQSELLVAASLLGAVSLYLRDRALGQLRWSTAAFIALLYVLACLSKEHGIVLPALLGAAELLVVHSSLSLLERARRLRPFYLILTLIAVSFVAARSLVLADHGLGGFQPFTPFSALHVTGVQRMLTALGVVPEWLRLLFWPAHLSAEYGPPGIEIVQSAGIAQLPGLLILIATLALAVVLRRREPVVSFGIAVVCITLLPSSNFLIPAGIVLAERTLFLPSLGAMLIVGAVAVRLAAYARARSPNPRRFAIAAGVLSGALLLTGALRSNNRTRVWHDNDYLFSQAVVDSPDAYRAHYMLGAWSFENHRFRLGESEYRKALALFPYDPNVSYTLAEQYRRLGVCAPAIPLYEAVFAIEPQFPMGHTALVSCLMTEKRLDQARSEALVGLSAGASFPIMHRVIFVVDSVRRADTRERGKREVVKAVGVTDLAGKVPESVQKTAPKHVTPQF
jgi:hypothetical protein